MSQYIFSTSARGTLGVLRTPAGRWIVIDGGPLTPQGDAGTRVVVPFLRRMGVERVAVVVATHGDADHLGGIPAVVAAFAPDLVLEPGEPLGRPHYLRFLATVEASGARYRAARAGDRIVLDGVTLEVLSPDSALFALPLDVNEHGVVLRVTYGDVRLLFQADAGLPVEQHLAGAGRGGWSCSRWGTMAPAPPRRTRGSPSSRRAQAVISVGRHNNYGHPAPEVVARLARHGIAIWRTDRDGTITFTTNGTREQTDIRGQTSGVRRQN